jgi:hypothetical protein
MPAIRPPLSEDEASDLVRGLREGLVEVDKGAVGAGVRFLSRMLPGLHAPIFKRAGPGKAELYREMITHFAALCALVLDRGYPADRIRTAYAGKEELDAIVTDAEGNAVIAMEAKSSPASLNTMLREVETCDLLEGACRHRDHPKIVGLRRANPKFLWAIAPGDRRAFRVDALEPRVTLTPVNDLPAGPATG